MDRPRINLLRIEEEPSEVHLRLARVQIENLPWQEFIKRYDREQTFFYLDPPYYKAPFYSHNLELKDYREMAEILSKIKASFILSVNDHPGIREIFDGNGFSIKPVQLRYSISRERATRGKELLIMRCCGWLL